MEPLLKTVAREYIGRYPDLKRFCFLFPNKRCGIFLKKYLAEFGKKSEEMPHILTISDFVAQIARKTEASRIVQLFTLFNSYKEVVGEEIELEFDTFRGWGETVLSDFNTVDINLADPHEIFKNVKDYREISSNFLTEEQKEVMREYFGIEVLSDSSSFWKTFEDPSKITDLQQKFLNLWQVLSPLHEKFLSSLSEKGLSTSGYLYRQAAEKILERGRDILPYNKIVIVGFNALTESERVIFKELQGMKGYAGFDDFTDFIWDATGPILRNKDFSASRFVNFNLKNFPMPGWLLPALEKNEVKDYPQIEIISSPSFTSQVKIAGEILKKYENGEHRKMISEAQVGLILPDESLLSNVLFSLPDNIGDINLTMGYSLRQSPIASFMSLLRRLYAGIRESKKGNIFYTKDLKLFFSHPFSYFLFPAEKIEELLTYVNKYHKISISLIEISDFLPSASTLLNFPSKKANEKEIFSHIILLFEHLKNGIASGSEKPEENQDISQIRVYQEYVEALQEAIEEYKIETSPLSVLQMIDKLVATEKIGFEGEPLSGLQVMGTLESRSLDFNHIIILSMNEGIMPRKSMSSTFIPESLRKAYGLPPANYAEEIFGYYFYRLISRAEKVSLIYDGRTISGMRSGESRYLLQLRQFLPKSCLHEIAWQFRLQNREIKDASIEKTPEIFEMIQSFSTPGKNGKNFSASSLNAYRECQVKFFLQNLLNISSDPEKGDYMNAIEIGDVLHNVMMELYIPSHLQRKLLSSPIVIDQTILNSILSNPELIKSLVEKNIQMIYYGNEDEEKKEVESGVTDIISEQIIELIKSIVKYDLTLAPFNLYGCEISENLKVKLSTGRTVNFRFAIDRLDEIFIDGEKRLRIIDYKTGKRKRKAKNLQEVFEGGYGSEQIFQLFIYAWLLGKKGIKDWEDVITEIYFVPDLIKGKRGLPELDEEEINSFRPYIREFEERLENLIESLFLDPVFKECPTSSSCLYCSFRSFCQK